MRKKLAIGIAAGVAAVALGLGIGIGAAMHTGAEKPAPVAENRPVKDGEVPAPPAPAQLKPSERVVVGK